MDLALLELGTRVRYKLDPEWFGFPTAEKLEGIGTITSQGHLPKNTWGNSYWITDDEEPGQPAFFVLAREITAI